MRAKKWSCWFFSGMMLGSSALALDFSQISRTDICGVAGPYYGFSKMETWMVPQDSLINKIKSEIEKKNALYGNPFDFDSTEDCYMFIRYDLAALELSSGGATYYLKISLDSFMTPHEVTMRGVFEGKNYKLESFEDTISIYDTYTMGVIPNKKDLVETITEVAIEQYENLLLEWRMAQK